MTYQQILKSVKTTNWWREESPGSVYLFAYIMKSFVSHKMVIGRPSLKKACGLFKDGIVTELTPYDEKKQVFRGIYQRSIKNNNYFEKLIKPLWSINEQQKNANQQIASLNLTRLTDGELLKLYQSFDKLNLSFVIYGSFFECIDPYTEKLPQLIKDKYHLGGKEVMDYIITLSTPESRSFLTQEKIDFYQTCLGQMSVDKFQRKYFWFDSNYKEAPELTAPQIKKRIEKVLAKSSKLQLLKEIEQTKQKERRLKVRKKEIEHKIKLSKKDQILFSLLSRFSQLIDIRKEGMLRSTFSRYKFLQEVSRRKKLDLNLMLFMSTSEVADIMADQDINLDNISQRKKGVVIYYLPTSEKIFIGQQAEKLYQAYLENLLSSEFKGNVAYDPGVKVQGQVCKIINTRTDKFRPGSVLVTTMTRPDFMHLMREAQAIITDEGGLTCHAAVISRELSIPCIIGTKVGTKVLKTGDKIEMDFETGMVKKVK